MACEIRLAQEADVAAIAEIGAITFARAYGDIVLESDMAGYVEAFFDPELLSHEIISGSATYFIAEGAEGIVGYAKIAQTEPPQQLAEQRVIELIRLYVMPGFYGSGIGGELLQSVKRYAAASGFAGLWLRVWEKNSGAIRLYERDGFSALAVEPYYIGTTANPVLLMCRALE